MAITKVLLLLTVLIIGGIALQIFLSLRPAKWPGLILPGICVLISLLYVFSNTTFSISDGPSPYLVLLVTALLSNIPTLILLAIYFACRQKHRKTQELNRMNIQDLE